MKEKEERKEEHMGGKRHEGKRHGMGKKEHGFGARMKEHKSMEKERK